MSGIEWNWEKEGGKNIREKIFAVNLWDLKKVPEDIRKGV